MPQETETRTISYDDFLKVTGLLVLAKEHYRAIDTIQRAVAGLVGEEDDGYGYFGHVSDAVSDDSTARDLLRKMNVEIEPEESA